MLKIFLLNLLEDDDSWGGDFFIPLIFGKVSSPSELFRDCSGHVTRLPAFLPLRRPRGEARLRRAAAGQLEAAARSSAELPG